MSLLAIILAVGVIAVLVDRARIEMKVDTLHANQVILMGQLEDLAASLTTSLATFGTALGARDVGAGCFWFG